jgi:hypothetical protein
VLELGAGSMAALRATGIPSMQRPTASHGWGTSAAEEELFLLAEIERRSSGTAEIYAGARAVAMKGIQVSGAEMSVVRVNFSWRQHLARDRGHPRFSPRNLGICGL